MLWQHRKVCIKNQYINIYFFFYFITLFTLHVYADKHTALKSVWKCLYYFYLLFHCPWDVYYYVAKHKPIDMKLDETIIFSKILLSTMKYGGLKMQVCILSVFFFSKIWKVIYEFSWYFMNIWQMHSYWFMCSVSKQCVYLW